MSTSSTHDVTRLLLAWRDGDTVAPSRLMPLVYDELRRLAREYLRHERGGHTLQPTALVHEAYLRLVDESQVQWQGRAHFFGVAAKSMRRILVDHARAHKAAKRGGGVEKIPLDAAGRPARRQRRGPRRTRRRARNPGANLPPARARWWNCASSAAWNRARSPRSSRCRRKRSCATGTSPSCSCCGRWTRRPARMANLAEPHRTARVLELVGEAMELAPGRPRRFPWRRPAGRTPRCARR